MSNHLNKEIDVLADDAPMAAIQILSCLDLTTLKGDETEEELCGLIQASQTDYGPVASLCVYPQYVSFVAKNLPSTTTKVCTVANFPSGENISEATFTQIERSLHEGAHEIDVVFPYKAFLAGEVKQVEGFVKQCRKVCNQYVLKVILETGLFSHQPDIYKASQMLIDQGIDFIKTSTGKVNQGATQQAVETILSTISDFQASQKVGCKISGGVRSLDQAISYYQLIEKHFGKVWCQPQHVRFGASQLLNDIINHLEKTKK